MYIIQGKFDYLLTLKNPIIQPNRNATDGYLDLGDTCYCYTTYCHSEEPWVILEQNGTKISFDIDFFDLRLDYTLKCMHHMTKCFSKYYCWLTLCQPPRTRFDLLQSDYTNKK